MSELSRDDVCVLLPTLNEGDTIVEVVEGFRDHGFENMLVMDGGSTDGTVSRAESVGAEVHTQSGSGKGQAFREALELISEPYILMADADGTYRPSDADAMLEPLADGADHVIGHRRYSSPDAMPTLNHLGNRGMNRLFSALYGVDYGDILSGYRAFRTETVRDFHLSADGFRIETELAVESVRRHTETAVVDVTYDSRPNGSESNLHPVADGWRILSAIYHYTLRTNPLLFFGIGAAISWGVGAALALYVVVEWVTTHVGHEAIAVGAATAILFGSQLFLFGVLSQQINRVIHELNR